MRLLFYYSSISNGSAPTGTCWEKSEACSQHPLMVNFHTEGLAWMLEKMAEEKIVDEYVVILESAKSPGKGKFKNGMPFYTVPHIDDSLSLWREDDVVWARGGFRSWPPVLERANREKKWLLFYRAATHRLKWVFWDVILDDLSDVHYQDAGGRFVYAFNKPVRPEYFKLNNRAVVCFDVILNASHIHDRKGQFKGIQAAIEYKKLFNQDLRVLLPGGFYHGENTNKIHGWISRERLIVELPGMVPRPQLAELMNQCKLYVHLGGGGQNDRGALEAMRCGLPVMVARKEFFPSFVTSHPQFSTVLDCHENPIEVAKAIHQKLSEYQPSWKPQVSAYYEQCNGDEVVLENMRQLFSFIRSHPKADRPAIINHFTETS